MEGYYIEIPVTSFKIPYSRTYMESYIYPPPSMVYGSLLSFVGETDRSRHIGCEMAIALKKKRYKKSKVLKTIHRFKCSVKDVDISENTEEAKKEIKNRGKNKVPDYQQLITDVEMLVWIRGGAENKGITLEERLSIALEKPSEINRFGGWSMGESQYLINDFRKIREEDGESAWFLEKKEGGRIVLPVWADHLSLKMTRWESYDSIEINFKDIDNKNVWTTIKRRAA